MQGGQLCNYPGIGVFDEMEPPLFVWIHLPIFTVMNALLLEHLQRCSICDPAKIFFTSKCSYVLFCNPTNKTESGSANRWGTANSKPHGPIIMMGRSETLSSSRSYLVHSFVQVHSAAAPRTSHGTCAQLCWTKPIFLSQTGSNWIFFIDFSCAQSHTEHRWRCS